MNPQTSKQLVIGGSIVFVIALISLLVVKYKNQQEAEVKPQVHNEEVKEAFKTAHRQLKKTLGKRPVADSQPKFEQVSPELSEVSSQMTQSHVIIVGQFKTEYFFEENSKKLNDNSIKFEVKTIGETRQIRIPLEQSQNPKLELSKLKASKIIPQDAYVKKTKHN